MIISGLGKTRFFGSPLNSIENVLNILEGLRTRVKGISNEHVANEVLVACVKLIVCEHTSKSKEAQEEFLDVIRKITHSEVELTNARSGGGEM